MLGIAVSGSPYEIGRQHGEEARALIHRGLKFYEDLFQKNSSLSWPQVCEVARKFLPLLEAAWPTYLDEIRGVAEGGGFEFESILALNVRTEIAYGMVTDGCTALSWKSSTNGLSFLAQNWDWQHEQKANLIRMEISQRDKPKIHMITEAGIIGKIGLNSAGVGVTLNAIKARGVDYNRLPCHLALRTVLESQSREVAVKQLENAGVASACHILVADKTGGIGLECGASDIIRLPMADGIVSHTNHYLEPHQILETKLAFPDSPVRLARIRELIQNAGPEPSASKIEQMLQDEKNYPASICRAETEKSTVATLFSIVMDLPAREARVKVGRPIKPESIIIMGRVRESSA